MSNEQTWIMNEAERLLNQYATAVQHPEASGFEVLELLDLRSRMVEREEDLGSTDQARLEEADGLFLHNAPLFFASLTALGDMPGHRRRAHVPCSHWWWYLEKITGRVAVEA